MNIILGTNLRVYSYNYNVFIESVEHFLPMNKSSNTQNSGSSKQRLLFCKSFFSAHKILNRIQIHKGDFDLKKMSLVSILTTQDLTSYD